MDVLEKATKAFGGLAGNALEVVNGLRTLHVYVSNGTDVPLVLAEGGSGAECKASFSNELAPGHAGVLNFAEKGDLHGSVQLKVGDELLSFTASNPRMGSPYVGAQFAKDGATTRSSKAAWWSTPEDGRGSFSASGAHAAQVSSASPSAASSAHVIVGQSGEISREPSNEKHGIARVNFGGRFVHEGFSSTQLLGFAEWCRSANATGLVGALFLAEYAAVLAGLEGLSTADKAFMLNLLVFAFISNGALFLHNLIPTASIEAELKRWRSQEPASWQEGRLAERGAYEGLPGGDELMWDYVDTALILLKTAAMQTGIALGSSMQEWLKTGEPAGIETEAQQSPSGSSMGTGGSEANCHLLLQHLGTRTMQNESTQRSHSKLEKTLTNLLRKCIHQSTAFLISNTAIFKAVEAQLPEGSARTALRCYMAWVPAARRSFDLGFMDGHDVSKVMGRGRKPCCLCPGHKKKTRDVEEVRCHSMGAELFAGLDGGATTSPTQVLASLGHGSVPYRAMSTNSKSGEFFFFSGDRRFIIKTISPDEGRLLFNMLPAYQAHLRRKARSLIVRYAGLYCMEFPGVGEKYFSVMASVFDPAFPIHETYDVKGSTFKRKRKLGEKIGKDEDWVTCGRKLNMLEETRRQLCAAHEQDAAFLMACGVMDYSLLIGIHQLGSASTGTGWRKPDDPCGGIWAEGEEVIYFVGLIDFLIWYGFGKQGEHIFRTVQRHGEDASCVDPLSYARRQVRFVRDQVVATPQNGQSAGTLGTLCVTLLAGHNLRRADLNAWSDPYVVVTLGLQRLRTHAVAKNCDPEWKNCTLYLAVDEAHLMQEVELSVWDSDLGLMQGSDDFLGRLTVRVAQLIQESSIELNKQALQDVKQGRLSAKLQFSPSSQDYYNL